MPVKLFVRPMKFTSAGEFIGKRRHFTVPAAPPETEAAITTTLLNRKYRLSNRRS
jgi:hypothetical protein